jgi:hypothetical protein
MSVVGVHAGNAVAEEPLAPPLGLSVRRASFGGPKT